MASRRPHQTELLLESSPASLPLRSYTADKRPPLSKPPELILDKNPYAAELCSIGRGPLKVEEPYKNTIEAGKNTYVYDAHTYHTKVPPEGIKQLVAYYTREDDVVLDPFCGSGMTGVAATELGRKALLSDLSPAAAFIAYNHSTPISPVAYLSAVRHILEQSRDLEHFLYSTHVRGLTTTTTMLYTVWSFAFLCSECGSEFVLWDVARDERESVRESKILSTFDCPHCHRQLQKRALTRTHRRPVQIGYPHPDGGTKEFTAEPDDYDLSKLSEIDRVGLPADLWFPKTPIAEGFNTRQPRAAGITRVDQCYTTRALWAFAHLWHLARQWPVEDVRMKLLFTLTSLYKRVTLFSEFRFWGGSGNTANLNVPAVMNEQNVFRTFERKAQTIALYFGHAPRRRRHVRVGCQSARDLSQLPDGSVDYIFTDPPFGGNINYSEMNILWEAWLECFTSVTDEAIINKYQNKGLEDYQQLLTDAFRESRRVLKDDAWMTVVFHNSSGQVWGALQSAILDAGFEVRGAQTFDKKHGTFKQFVSDNAVGYDLVLHCQKASRSTARVQQRSDRALRHARAFIRRRLSETDSAYSVHYLHVRRADEFDYRRLYADWLQNAIQKVAINIGFEEFRKLVDTARVPT